MGVDTGDVTIIEGENVEAGKRIGKAPAAAEVIIPEQTVVLGEPFWCVDLAGKNEAGRRQRSESEPAMCPLPGYESPRHKPPSPEQVSAFQFCVAAVVRNVENALDESVRIASLHG
jgi:hypothetical protein